MPDAFPVNQPTVQSTEGNTKQSPEAVASGLSFLHPPLDS